MKLEELTRPIRIYWDLTDSPFSLHCLKICEEILEIRILFLSLKHTVSTLSPALFDILNKLKDGHIAVSLTLSSSVMTPSIVARLSDSGSKTVLINALSLSEVRASVQNIKKYGNSGLTIGISFDVGKDNFRELPDVVSLCLNNGLPYLVFPIQRLINSGDCFYINREEREKLALKLKGTNYGNTQITIHDPFLWKAFYPDSDYSEGGCQAANSMLYISPDYRVYPCPAMPIILGSLFETTLEKIALSTEKKDIRNILASPPVGSARCSEEHQCTGGCRGRSYVLTQSLRSCDPACM